MMARVIHGKTEKDVRSKFNYEEKKNKKKVEEHLEVDDLSGKSYFILSMRSIDSN